MIIEFHWRIQKTTRKLILFVPKEKHIKIACSPGCTNFKHVAPHRIALYIFFYISTVNPCPCFPKTGQDCLMKNMVLIYIHYCADNCITQYSPKYI